MKIILTSGTPWNGLGTLRSCWTTLRKPLNILYIQQYLSHVFFFFKLFIYFWLCWVFVSVRGFSVVAASGGHSSSQCMGLSLLWPLLLRSTGSRRAGSVVVAHGPSCSAACGIFPDQGSNPCPLHWQADSQPLHHQGSPWVMFCMKYFRITKGEVTTIAETLWKAEVSFLLKEH